MCTCNNLMILNTRRLWNPMAGKVEFEVMQECTQCGRVWIWSNLHDN